MKLMENPTVIECTQDKPDGVSWEHCKQPKLTTGVRYILPENIAKELELQGYGKIIKV